MNEMVQRYQEFYRVDNLDREAWSRVTSKDYRELLRAHPFTDLLTRASRAGRLEMLDVGCGTGLFPSLVALELAASRSALEVDVDYLDPVLDNLTAFATNAVAPFRPRTRLACTLEALDGPEQRYDVVWCMHSLYAISWPVEQILLKLRRLLRPETGVCVIYQIGERSFYQRFYCEYLRSVRGHDPQTVRGYPAAEQTRAALHGLGFRHRERTLDLHHEIDARDSALLHKYLKQCALDENLTLAAHSG